MNRTYLVIAINTEVYMVNNIQTKLQFFEDEMYKKSTLGKEFQFTRTNNLMKILK